MTRSSREVQVFIYRAGGRDRHQVLVFHRTPEHGAHWHTVAGAVEGPETGAEAAVRELREETGLNPAEPVIELGHCYRYPIEVEAPERRSLHSADVRAIRGESFAIEVSAGWEPRLNAEDDGYQWCTLDEAERLVYWTATKAALGVLGRRLRRSDAPPMRPSATLAAVIFDLDGLLADTEAIHYEAWRAVLEDIGLMIGQPEYCEHWIRAGRGVEEYLARHGLGVDAEELRRQKSRRYLDLLARDLRPMPGALELLARLHGRVSLALASSSWQRHVEAVLDHLEIADLFDVVAVGESVARLKPAPDIFVYTARRLAADPRACVVLEDAEKGVLAARAAGMAVVAVPTAHTATNDFSAASLVVRSLHELTLDRLERLVYPAPTWRVDRR